MIDGWLKTVKNSQKTVKTAKMTIAEPIVTMSTQSSPPNTQSPVIEFQIMLLCTKFHQKRMIFP